MKRQIIKIFCDRCGAEIERRVYSAIFRCTDEVNDAISLDLCEECVKDVQKWIRVKTPETEARKSRTRIQIDDAAVFDMREAGKSLVQIKEELGINASLQTIANHYAAEKQRRGL